MHQPSISVIIPVHNGGTHFKRCLESVTGLEPPPKEIIVVDDGSTDRSGQLAEEFGAKLLTLPESGGPAGARNKGARAAGEELLYFVDADVVLPRDALRLISDAFREDPGLSALFGSYDDDPWETNFLSQYRNLLHHYVHQHARREGSTFWGACGAIRREVFLSHGGFDVGYRRPAIEDIELGYRLVKAGYRIRVLKELQVKHLKRWGIKSLLKADFFYRALPWTRLIMREGRFVNDLNIDVSSRVSVVCVYLVILTLLSGILFPWLLPAALFPLLIFLWLNRDLYLFFTRKRGLLFSLKSIPWHGCYFIYSGLAFLIGWALHHYDAMLNRERN